MSFINILLAAQREINAADIANNEDSDYPLHVIDFRSRLLFADLGTGLEIEYYGDVEPDGEPCVWQVFLEALTQPAVANNLTSLRITGADEGANGSRTHDFTDLLSTTTQFPTLVNLFIRPTGVTDHNMVDIMPQQIANLIARCPKLENLTLPHPPEADFFENPLPRLHYLRTGMGWQTHDFIKHLAKSQTMPSLGVLDFTDSLNVFRQNLSDKEQKGFEATPAETASTHDFLKSLGFDNETLLSAEIASQKAQAEVAKTSTFDDKITSFEDYEALLKSTPLKLIHLRNAYLNQSQFSALHTLRPDVQLSA
ncbi:MAG: hypothetical protein H7Z20_11010 [Bdellovibrio sp.]|nr:hypothetical protein [Methylotenera sp.]